MFNLRPRGKMRKAKCRGSDPSRQKGGANGKNRRKSKEESRERKGRAEGGRAERKEEEQKSKIAIESRLPPPRVTPGEDENVNAGAHCYRYPRLCLVP